MPFVIKNESFICEYCGENNPPAPKTCRNHCRKCLWSKHVDQKFPGDRQSECKNLMKPIKIIGDIDNLQIIHKCEKCDKEIINKTADDDNFEEILRIQKGK